MLYIEPHAGPAPIVHLIQGSHRELDIGVYYLDDRKILVAVRAAVRRGVDVRIMVEPKPPGFMEFTPSSSSRAPWRWR